MEERPKDGTGAEIGRDYQQVQGPPGHGQVSQVFLVRLWEAPSAGGSDWHGRVQHVLRGESHSFSSLDGLVAHLQSMARRQSGAPLSASQATAGTTEASLQDGEAADDSRSTQGTPDKPGTADPAGD